MPFSAPVCMKFVTVQRHCVEFVHTSFHQDRSINMEIKGINSYSHLSKVGLLIEPIFVNLTLAQQVCV
jgi:hypothetical protein